MLQHVSKSVSAFYVQLPFLSLHGRVAERLHDRVVALLDLRVW